jgi:hypothetical protein
MFFGLGLIDSFTQQIAHGLIDAFSYYATFSTRMEWPQPTLLLWLFSMAFFSCLVKWQRFKTFVEFKRHATFPQVRRTIQDVKM